MQLRSILLLLLFLSGVRGNTQPAVSLDTVLASLKNSELYVAPVIRGVSIVPRTEGQVKEYYPSFVVGSLAQDIRTLAEIYTKKLLAKKLYLLLNDPGKDLYANALLYDLLDNRNLGKLFGMKRKVWINSGKQQCDMEFWRSYFSPGLLPGNEDQLLSVLQSR
jgi:hypothetical protein